MLQEQTFDSYARAMVLPSPGYDQNMICWETRSMFVDDNDHQSGKDLSLR